MKKLQLFLFAVSVFTNAHAQKLPNVQQESLRVPANLKIDGKPTEWGKFAAYNNATSLRYTMANDDKNLYLALQADDPNVLTKITNRGVILTINPSGQKNDKNTVTIHYPVYELQYSNKPFIQFSNAGGLTANERAANAANPDSMLIMMNKRLHANDKFIRTSGITGLDTLLSIYNEKDVMAGQGFEKGQVYTYELAIPLKYLNIKNDMSKFSYHIVLEGLDIRKDMGLTVTATGVRMATGVAIPRKDDLPVVTATSDFWGDYTLAK